MLPLLVKFHPSKKWGFREWLDYRSIPKTRRDLKRMLLASGVPDRDTLLIKNLGLSLSDPYWFLPKSSDLTWEEVNLYENDFFPMEVEGSRRAASRGSFHPNASSNGELCKFWSIEDGRRVLYKESARPYLQQAANEQFAR